MVERRARLNAEMRCRCRFQRPMKKQRRSCVMGWLVLPRWKTRGTEDEGLFRPGL